MLYLYFFKIDFKLITINLDSQPDSTTTTPEEEWHTKVPHHRSKFKQLEIHASSSLVDNDLDENGRNKTHNGTQVQTEQLLPSTDVDTTTQQQTDNQLDDSDIPELPTPLPEETAEALEVSTESSPATEATTPETTTVEEITEVSTESSPATEVTEPLTRTEETITEIPSTESSPATLEGNIFS